MPAPRGSQNNTMLYAVITFAALFIIATVVAIIYYIKAEDYRTAAVNLQKETDELATPKELRNLGKTVGQRIPKTSRLGAMQLYLSELTEITLGETFPDTSAQVKVEKAQAAYNDTLMQLSAELTDVRSAGKKLGLVRIAQILAQNLKNTRNLALALQTQLNSLQQEYDVLLQADKQKQQEYFQQIKALADQARQTQQGFNELKTEMEDNTAQQIENLQTRLTQTAKALDKQHQDLLREKAEHFTTKQSRDIFKKQLDGIKHPPDTDVPAYKADGKIISVDDQAKLVFLNVGTNDHVYRGLTFSVYDKNIPIPRDGKSKAEIEVLDTEKNVSVARIIRSKPKNPVIPDDMIANLIWDSDQTNIFVVAGDFDFNGDGEIDTNGRERIVQLIEKWGGKVAQTVSIETNFLVLGLPPRILTKPTHEDLEIDPLAAEKYQNSLKRLNQYKDIHQQAQALAVPIFSTERFLYFIGYKSLADSRPAF